MSSGVRALGTWLLSVLEEIGIIVGVVLVAVGFWQTWPPGAFFFAGGIVLWVIMPSRAPFVTRLPRESDGRKRRTPL